MQSSQAAISRVAHGSVPKPNRTEPCQTAKAVQFGSNTISSNYNHYTYIEPNYFKPVIWFD